jgi:glycine/D-amino acid oxidase-like deaminating enzyme/nitrite reductase/ring-hydroxylating ferredoxin subunit
LERERRAASEAGISCELVRAAPLAIASGPALHVPHQAELDPLAFLAGVVRALQELDVAIYAPVTVQDFDLTKATDQVGLRTSDGHSIRANFVVVASNSPINDQAAYRTYALSLAIAQTEPALCWDLEDPYHYVRTAFDATTQQPILIVGGEDHRVGQDPDHGQQWTHLEDWARQRFPGAGVVVSRWSGQVLEASDGLAFIGKNPGDARVLVLTGASGNGMSYAGLGAELIGDLLHGVENPFQKLYDPARKPASLGAIGRFVRENLNTMEQYSDWVGPADAASAADIERGEGAVLRRGLTRVAVYVDDSGLAHELSASCPHWGGVVAWNSAEKSWDCPCHGSRFDCHGKVLAGPAVSDLVPLAKPKRDVEQAS